MLKDSNCPTHVITGLRYHGEAVFKQFNEQKTVCHIFSHELRKLDNGSIKFVRWIPLKEIKIDLRYGSRHKAGLVRLAIDEVTQMPGMALVATQ